MLEFGKHVLNLVTSDSSWRSDSHYHAVIEIIFWKIIFRVGHNKGSFEYTRVAWKADKGFWILSKILESSWKKGFLKLQEIYCCYFKDMFS